MAISGTLGAMLQGISQQPSYLRQDGQVGEQINFLPDVTRGLTTRPGSKSLGDVFTGTANASWQSVDLKGERIYIATGDGVVRAFKPDGTEIPVTGGTNTYCGDNSGDIRAFVFEDQIYLLNRNVNLEMSPATILPASEGQDYVTVDGLSWRDNSSHVSCLAGRFSNIYTLVVSYSDGTSASVNYATPDGTTDGDADKIAPSYILERLQTFLEAKTEWKGTSVSQLKNGVLAIWDTAVDLEVSVYDGFDNTALRVQNYASTKEITDLPKFAKLGTVAKVIGEGGPEDDIWFRYEDGHFGQGIEGAWVEGTDPRLPHSFDLQTFPHVLDGDSTGLTLSTGAWKSRRTGDATSNPEPSFIGSRVRDVSGFQSRLVFISGKRVIMSTTNDPLDFWADTAYTVLDTDPVDLLSTTDEDYALEWLLPFDRDLVIFGQNSQFLISGSSALTPSNASILPTTNYESSILARPVNTGRTVLFPFLEGGFAGVKEFYASSTTESNAAITLTKVQSRLMPREIINMSHSANYSLMVCSLKQGNVPAVEKRTLYAYQHYFNGEENVQSAWFKLVFPFNVEHFAFDGSTLHMILRTSDHTEWKVGQVEFDIPDQPGLNYHVALDLKRTFTAVPGTDSTFTQVTGTGEPNVQMVQGTGCAVPGGDLSPLSIVDEGGGQITYTFPSDIVPDGAEIIAGVPMGAEVQPTMPLYRDGEGKPISNAKLTVNSFIVYFENSGSMECSLVSPYRTEDRVYSNKTIPIYNDPDDPDMDGVSSGEFRFRWGERSDRSALKITTTDVRPLTITEIEWEGQVQQRGQRR